ncbi:hypothetical protein [Homoserinimonas hongtaonis]|uniref:hypothetical protein n=1 Tax=Homoserinimonas hongtaonis TaxID=2079791 RepID=UPI00131F45AA|nr:hypothetical protein [Salinibacterium hongtaonis]
MVQDAYGLHLAEVSFPDRLKGSASRIPLAELLTATDYARRYAETDAVALLGDTSIDANGL